ncbi:unnamed protein product [Sympodiomycopsis kandeliae]
MPRGAKRPRKSTALSNNAAATTAASAGNSTAPSSSAAAAESSKPGAGPKDIARSKTTQQLQQDDLSIGMAYSSTPPNKPTKKPTRGNSIRSKNDTSPRRSTSLQSNTNHTSAPTSEQDQDKDTDRILSQGKTPIRPVAPVKSALAASARLAAGPPGALNIAGGNAASSSAIGGNLAYKKRMYVAFVDNAFADREKGSSKSYWDLVSQFRSSALASNGPSGVQSLSLWLQALSHHVSKLDSSSHSQLVDNILDLPWAGAGDEFSRTWCRFICALVSARVEWAPSVLERIIKAFRWRSNWLPIQPLSPAGASALMSPSTSTLTSATTPASQPTRRMLYTKCHLLLRALLTLIPTLPSSLSPLVMKHFPHKREGKREQATYTRNILFMTQYEPQVAESVWRVVIDRAIGLDVEIQIELDDLEEEAGDDDDDDGDSDSGSGIDPFDLVIDDEEGDEDDDEEDDGSDQGDFNDISDDEADGYSDEDELGRRKTALNQAQILQREKKVRDMVTKLDGILKVCFEHLDYIGKGKGRQQNELVLDSRPSWLSEFLGRGGVKRPGSGSTTPTLERSGSSATLRAKAEQDEETALDSDGSSEEPRMPPPSGIAAARSPPRLSEEDDEATQASKDALFQQLLKLFSRSILPTFKCRHVQFLLFWYCSLDTDFADYFLGLLIHKAIYAGSANGDGIGTGFDNVAGSAENPSDAPSGRARGEPIVLRQASASYVASFVSRAKYISPSYTRTVVYNLCSYLEAHLEAYSNAITYVTSIGGLNGVDEKTQRLATAPPGSEEHAIFYAVAQAVFYIFCFRWQDLQSTPSSSRGSMNGLDVLNGLQDSRATDASGVEFEDHEQDSGFMIGSLSSTGSPSYDLPSSFDRLATDDVIGSNFKHRNKDKPTAEEMGGNGPDSSSQQDWSPGLSVLQRAILSPLNPLQFCSPTVVHQFATVAQHVGFLYCWSVIESNRRGGRPVNDTETMKTPQDSKPNHKRSVPKGNGSTLTKDLEGFFPFDPYRLNSTSDSFIKPMYRDWDEVVPPGMISEDEDDESTSGSDDDDVDDDDTESDEEDAILRQGLSIPGRA